MKIIELTPGNFIQLIPKPIDFQSIIPVNFYAVELNGREENVLGSLIDKSWHYKFTQKCYCLVPNDENWVFMLTAWLVMLIISDSVVCVSMGEQWTKEWEVWAF